MSAYVYPYRDSILVVEVDSEAGCWHASGAVWLAGSPDIQRPWVIDVVFDSEDAAIRAGQVAGFSVVDSELASRERKPTRH